MSRTRGARLARSSIFVFVSTTLLTLTIAPREVSADERVECAAAYEQTQRLQQRSEVMEALELAERCARPTCPGILKDECTKWVAELKPKVSSLVVRARGDDGCTRADAKIEVAGSRRSASEPDVLLLDPGVHEIKVTDPSSKKTKTETINFAPGERRDIDVDFSSPPGRVCGQTLKKPPMKLTKLTLIVGSTGGGLIVLGATLGLIGAVKRGDLDDCKPTCSEDRLDAVRPFFIAGDVFAGLGILAAGAAAVMFFMIDNKPGTTSSSVTIARGRAAAGEPARENERTRENESARWRLVINGSGVGASF